VFPFSAFDKKQNVTSMNKVRNVTILFLLLRRKVALDGIGLDSTRLGSWQTKNVTVMKEKMANTVLSFRFCCEFC